ncbi:MULTISPECIES: hypothetical protein [Clostridium]|uniref:Uncharacterized protein n=1 Tax=Clostridium cibarium TaxID=2762247 RepID=A0ABR8PW00_9CLOT|nr:MULTISPECIES: hypothetical protein [Clostridium]MBD7912362.1 hypothetical protein [Clostridium cibarium]
MKRLLIALGLSITFILNLFSFSVAANEEQKIEINLGIKGRYTVYIPSKVEFGKDEIKNSNNYISKDVNIIVDNNNFIINDLKVKVSNDNNFLLVGERKKSIEFSLYDKKFDENNLELNRLKKGDYIDMRAQYELDDFWAIIEWFIRNFFNRTLVNAKYGQCLVVLDKNKIYNRGKFTGSLTFQFEVS